MSFLGNLFGKKKAAEALDNSGFWDWFMANEKLFFETLKQRRNMEKKFLNPVVKKLHQVNKQFFCLAGMKDENTAELIITPEGDVKSIVFVEELVNAAPALNNWVFTALKPGINIADLGIEMNGIQFNKSNIFFVNNNNPKFPDEIDLTLVHNDYTEENKDAVSHGIFIFLDNGLGELNTVTQIDNIVFAVKKEVTKELIPIEKLEAYLNWRQKEFIEKYQHANYNTENDTYSALQAHDKNDKAIIAVVNQVLLDWDAKASHPWMNAITIKYEGDKDNGLPDAETYDLMNKFEEILDEKLPNANGYLNAGRQIHDGVRTIWFASKEFRNISKITADTIKNYGGTLNISYDIFKDKYWMALEKFRNATT